MHLWSDYVILIVGVLVYAASACCCSQQSRVSDGGRVPPDQRDQQFVETVGARFAPPALNVRRDDAANSIGAHVNAGEVWHSVVIDMTARSSLPIAVCLRDLRQAQTLCRVTMSVVDRERTFVLAFRETRRAPVSVGPEADCILLEIGAGEAALLYEGRDLGVPGDAGDLVWREAAQSPLNPIVHSAVVWSWNGTTSAHTAIEELSASELVGLRGGSLVAHSDAESTIGRWPNPVVALTFEPQVSGRQR